MIEQANKVLEELLDSITMNQRQIKLLGRIDASAFDRLDQQLAATTTHKLDRPASKPTSGGAPKMTPHQITIVQDTWKQVLPIQDSAADLIYSKLFELDPSLRSLFPEDLAEQKKKLMQMITTAVRGLTKLDAIVPAVQALGTRHAGYRVTPAMYDTVAAALLHTLGKGLGKAWTPEAKEAWTLTYTTLATVMIQAQHDEKAAA